MKPAGGSELLYNNLLKHTGSDWQKQINLILSFCYSELLDPNRINVLWQHLACNQQSVVNMENSNFVKSVDHFVYVSNWQLKHYADRVDISIANNHIIKNAIQPIEFIEKPKDKIKLIYTSMPNRGLEVLLDAFQIINRDDIELTVYSSDIIYGKNYKSNNSEYLFHRCRTTPGVIYKGYAVNKAVRQAVQRSHILAYPSIYEETSCLAAIEAGAAGCKIVTTNLGALPETCEQWATYVDHSFDNRELAYNYAEVLNSMIDNYQSSCYNLQEQSDWFNNTYSWENRSKEWKEFFNKICVR